MDAPLPMMLAQLDIGTLTTEPAPVSRPDGLVVYTAKADVGFLDKGLEVVFLPTAQGVALPYVKGDRLLLLFNHGTAYVLGQYGVGVEHGGNTMLCARGSADVRLGAAAGGAWEALALHARLAAEVVELKAQIDAVVTVLAAVPGASAITATIEGRDVAIGPITGGDAAAQVKARPA